MLDYYEGAMLMVKGRSNAKAELAMRAKCHIEENYKDKFSLEELAVELYCNGCYLLRTFKEQTGHTLLEYHNLIRCEHSKALLANPNISISYISDAVGYVTQAHYTRVFKKIYNCSPTQYRKQLCISKRGDLS